MARNVYTQRLNKTDTLIAQGHYNEAVTTAARAIEMLLDELFGELLKNVSPRDELALSHARANAVEGKAKMTLGRWAHFYRKQNIFDWLERTFEYDLHMFNSGTLFNVTDVRNECMHKDFQPTSAQAAMIRQHLEVYLEETGRSPQLPLPVEKQEDEPQGQGKLPSWTSIVVPNRDIRERRFDLGVFAIHLGEIALGEAFAQDEYKDAETFFDLTYVTRGLRSQLVTMMQRVANKRTGYAVVQLDTTFGGGKTHTLLSMYHIAKSGNRLTQRDDVRGLMNEARIESLPECAVAVLDGSYLSPSEPRVTPEGITLQTLWGEMAYQLGGAEGYEFVRNSDESRTAPGSGVLRELLTAVGMPSLILMDEVLDYATKAASVRVGRNTFLVDQVQSFLKALTQAVDRHGTSMLVLTLTSSPQQIYGEEAQRLQQRIAEQEAIFRNTLDRVQRSEVIAEDVEIYEILRRRLFQDLGDPNERATIARDYRQYYQDNADHFPDHVAAPGYRDRIAKSYPFHPDLIDVLQGRWGTIQNFQKTRGVLRLLALVVSNLFRKNHGAPLIHTGHIDLADPEIRRELLGHVDSPQGYDAAIGSDIAGQADSKARRRDLQIAGDYYRFGLCEGLATSMFMYSHSGSSGFVGGNRPQLWLSVLQPDIGPALAADVYSKLESELWYMEKDSVYTRIGIEPNLNQMLVEYRDSVAQDRERLNETILKEIENMAGDELRRAIIWPNDSHDVRDTDELKFVIARTQFAYKEDDNEQGAQIYIEDILKNAGNKHREYRNTIIFLLPTPSGVSNVETAATRLLALEDIEQTRGAQLKERQREELLQQLRIARGGLPSAVWGAYTVIATADSNSDFWVREESGISSFRPGDSLAQRALHKLTGESRLLTQFDPDLILRRDHERFKYLWPTDKTVINTLELWKNFPRYDYLPMLKDERVLRDTIAWGVSRGLFAYCTGKPERFDNIHIDEHLPSAHCVLSDHAWLLDAATARKLLAPPSVPDEVDDSGSKPNGDEPSDDGDSILPSGVDRREPKRCKKIGVKIKLESSNWRQFHSSVIKPLVDKGADINIFVSMSATQTDGFDRNFVELSIREGAIQINPTAEVEIDPN